jgi:predicted transcriptional regulator
MISEAQIKINLIKKILGINDISALSAIDDILKKSKEKDGIYKVSVEQLDALKAAEEDIKYGRISTNEEVNAEEDEWLKE